MTYTISWHNRHGFVALVDPLCLMRIADFVMQGFNNCMTAVWLVISVHNTLLHARPSNKSLGQNPKITTEPRATLSTEWWKMCQRTQVRPRWSSITSCNTAKKTVDWLSHHWHWHVRPNHGRTCKRRSFMLKDTWPHNLIIPNHRWIIALLEPVAGSCLLLKTKAPKM